MKQDKRKNNGGKRKGSGRKKGAQSSTISFRIKDPLKAEFYAKYGDKVSEMLVDFVASKVET